MPREQITVPGIEQQGCLLGGCASAGFSMTLPILFAIVIQLSQSGGVRVGLDKLFVYAAAAPLFLAVSVVPAIVGGVVNARVLARLARSGTLSLRSGLFCGAALGILWGGVTFLSLTMLAWSTPHGWRDIRYWEVLLQIEALAACTGLLQSWLLIRYVRVVDRAKSQ